MKKLEDNIERDELDYLTSDLVKAFALRCQLVIDHVEHIKEIAETTCSMDILEHMSALEKLAFFANQKREYKTGKCLLKRALYDMLTPGFDAAEKVTESFLDIYTLIGPHVIHNDVEAQLLATLAQGVHESMTEKLEAFQLSSQK